MSNADTSERQRLLATLRRFELRMRTRATPFGGFAAVGLASLKDLARPTVSLGQGEDPFRLAVRKGSGAIDELKFSVDRTPDCISLNPTLWVSSEAIRYTSAKVVGGEAFFEYQEVEPDDAITHVIAIASQTVAFEEASQRLADAVSCTSEDAAEYLNELLQAQVLVPTVREASVLNPPVLISDLHFKDARIEQFLSKRPSDSTTSNVSQHAKQGRPESSKTAPDIYLFNTYIRNAQISLPSGTFKKFNRALEALSAINEHPKDRLALDFLKRFSERYEDALVPVLEAVCPVSGVRVRPVGADMGDFLKGFPTPVDRSQTTGDPKYASLLIEKFLDSVKSGGGPIRLTSDQLLGSGHPVHSAKSLTALITMLRPSADDGPEGILSMAKHSTGAEYIGRFTPDSEEISELAKTLVEYEEHAEAEPLVEIVYCPGGKLRNIVSRKALCRYYVDLTGGEVVEGSIPLQLSKLFVCGHKGRLKLFSSELSKFVRPRLFAAHNFAHKSSHDLYVLFCLLDEDNSAYFHLKWPSALEQRAYLPRVMIDSLTVLPAQWRLSRSEIESARRAAIPPIPTDAPPLPRHIYLREGDKKLYLDLQDSTSLEIFFQESRGTELLVLEAPEPFELGYLELGDHAHACEALVHATAPKHQNPIESPPLNVQLVAHRADYGDLWVYFKLYCAPENSNQVIQTIQGAIQGLNAKSFWLRYADPEPHVRWRVQVEDSLARERMSDFMRRAIEPLVTGDVVTRVASQRYVPEVWRYGGWQCLSVAETVFHLDSEHAFRCIELSRRKDSWYQYALLLATFDAVMSAADFTLENKFRLVVEQAGAFASEHKSDKRHSIWIDKIYRKHRPAGLFEYCTDHPIDNAAKAELRRYLEAVRTNLSTVLGAGASIELSMPFREVLKSILHMTANRQLSEHHRRGEFVCYELLSRHYRAVAAQAGIRLDQGAQR